MAIEDRKLKPGTKLVARYKGQAYICEVIESKDGIRYRLPSKTGQDRPQAFKSPSAAGRTITGHACNGWRFWSLEGQEPKAAANYGAPGIEAAREDAEKADTKDFRRIPGGRAWCDACAAAFKIETGTTPTVCPQGHNPEGITIDAEKEAVTA